MSDNFVQIDADKSRDVRNALNQGCATGGPRTPTRPAKPFSVVLATLWFFPIMH